MDRKKKYDNKLVRKTIRFTKSDYEEIMKQTVKANVTFTEFVRIATTTKKITLPIEKMALYELNKIGVNLNQIARAINRKEDINIALKLEQIQDQISNISW